MTTVTAVAHLTSAVRIGTTTLSATFSPDGGTGATNCVVAPVPWVGAVRLTAPETEQTAGESSS